MTKQWQQQGNEWRSGDARAMQDVDSHAFVITAFGAEADADDAFAAIRAATAFGNIRLRVTPETRPIIDQLAADRRIKGASTIGMTPEEFGVMAIKTK